MRVKEQNSHFEEWWKSIHVEGYEGTPEEKRIAWEAFHEGIRFMQSRVRSVL